MKKAVLISISLIFTLAIFANEVQEERQFTYLKNTFTKDLNSTSEKDSIIFEEESSVSYVFIATIFFAIIASFLLVLNMKRILKIFFKRTKKKETHKIFEKIFFITLSIWFFILIRTLILTVLKEGFLELQFFYIASGALITSAVSLLISYLLKLTES